MRSDGASCAPDEVGEIKVCRRGGWIATRDRGWVDGGWISSFTRAALTMSLFRPATPLVPFEVEDVLLQHPDVHEAAVIGVPDDLRGHVVKAYSGV